MEFLKKLLGLDKSLEAQWERDTAQGIEEIKQKHISKGTFNSGMRESEVARYKMKQDQNLRDERRKRLIEGLGVIPPWFSLLLSLVALVVSIVALAS